MSFGQIAVLGSIAGATIFLGLPLGRVNAVVPRLKTGLNALATGILLFLFWDVTSHAWVPVDHALSDHDLGAALTNGAVLAVTLSIGLIGLVWVDRFAVRRGEPRTGGPGAASLAELQMLHSCREWDGRAAACHAVQGRRQLAFHDWRRVKERFAQGSGWRRCWPS